MALTKRIIAGLNPGVLAKWFRGTGATTIQPTVYDGPDLQKIWHTHIDQSNSSSEHGKTIAQGLQGTRGYVELYQGETDNTLGVLKALELVHKTDEDGLLKRLSPKLGDAYSNRCFAQVRDFMVNKNVNRDVLATIYMHSVNVSTINGTVDPSQLTPLLRNVKNQDNIEIPKPKPGEVRVGMFYTVSANRAPKLSWNQGGARDVIFYAAAQAEKEAREQGYKLITTTLSPMRPFQEWYPRFYPNEDLTADTEQGEYSKDKHILIKKRALEYYLRGADLVGFKVHGPNGSVLTEIKIDPTDEDDPLQANHLYSQNPEFLNSIRTEFNKGKGRIPMASHLCDFVKEHLPDFAHLVHEIDHERILNPGFNAPSTGSLG
jgi:hypothetical protein